MCMTHNIRIEWVVWCTTWHQFLSTDLELHQLIMPWHEHWCTKMDVLHVGKIQTKNGHRKRSRFSWWIADYFVYCAPSWSCQPESHSQTWLHCKCLLRQYLYWFISIGNRNIIFHVRKQIVALIWPPFYPCSLLIKDRRFHTELRLGCLITRERQGKSNDVV